MGEGDQTRAVRDRGVQRVQDLCGRQVADLDDPERGARGGQAAEEARVLGVRRHHLVAGADSEACEHDVAAPRRRACERDVLRRGVQEAGELPPELLTPFEQALEVLLARPPLEEIAFEDAGHRLRCPPWQRTIGSRVQIGEPLENGELGPNRAQLHAITASTGAWSERRWLFTRRRSLGHRSGPRSSSRPRTRIWSIPSIGGEKSGPVKRGTLKSPQSTTPDAGRKNSAASPTSTFARSGLFVACRLPTTRLRSSIPTSTTWQTRR